MGYPMTWQRVLNRNGLAQSVLDYHSNDWYGTLKTVDNRWHLTYPFTLPEYIATADEEKLRSLLDVYIKYGQQATEDNNSRVSMFLGDLRRFVHDAVDEDGICKYIAEKTHIDENDVAAVLKEFMAW